MLIFFRNIHFTTALLLALYIGLLHAGALTGQFAPPPSMEDAGFLYLDLFGWANDAPFWSALAAALLVFIQSLTVNWVADYFRLMNDRNWLPGMAYAMAASALPEFQFLSPPLLAATFLPLSLRFVFQVYKSPRSPILVFDAAFWIGVAALFYPKTLPLLPAIFIGVSIMRSWGPRDQLVFLSGAFVPTFLGWLWYFWGDKGSEFRDIHLERLLGIFRFDNGSGPMMWFKLGLLAFMLLVLVLNYNSIVRSKSMHAQKCSAVMYWVLFNSAIMMLLRSEWHWEVFALSAAPAGIFLAMTYQTMRSFFAEILHLILLLWIVFLQFNEPILNLLGL